MDNLFAGRPTSLEIELILTYIFSISSYIYMFYVILISKTYREIPYESKTLNANLISLLIIPMFNLAWQFYVIKHLAVSLKNEYKRLNAKMDIGPTINVAILVSIFFCAILLPIFGVISGILALINLIIFRVKIAKHMSRIKRLSVSKEGAIT